MGEAAREALFLRLSEFLRAVRHDPVFRRLLRHDPDAALAPRGLPCGLSESLPVLPPAEAHLESGLLFGSSGGQGHVAMPLELRLVFYGAKPLALIHGEEGEMSAVLRAAEARGFCGVLSAEEWQPVQDPALAGYSNLVGSSRWARPGSGAWRSLLVGPDEATVALAWLARTFHWDDLLGRLLGYPACCTRAFEQRWPDAVLHWNGDVAPLAASDCGPGPHEWRVNVFGRYFGHELIQHFPCHFDCERSLAMAADRANALGAFEPRTLEATRGVLGSPYLVAGGQGGGDAECFRQDGVVALLGAETTRRESGWKIRFDPARTLATAPGGSLAQWVARGSGRLEIDDRGTVVASDGNREPPLAAHFLLFDTPGTRGFAEGERCDS